MFINKTICNHTALQDYEIQTMHTAEIPLPKIQILQRVGWGGVYLYWEALSKWEKDCNELEATLFR